MDPLPPLPDGAASVDEIPAQSSGLPPLPEGAVSADSIDVPPMPLSGPIGANKVPVDAVPDALQGQGTNAMAHQVVQKVLGPNPIGDTVTNVAKHAKNDTWGLGKAMLTPPQNFGESVANTVAPGALQIYRAGIEPSIQPAQQAVSEFEAGNPDWQKQALNAVPIAGPAVHQFSDEYEKEGLLPALAGAGVDYLTGKAIGAGVKAVSGPGTMVPGQNYTQGQHASLSGVLARGSTADKGFFPKDVATNIGSATRQAAADNPAIHDAIMNGTPEESLAGTQALLQKVRQGIDTQHAQALAPVKNTPINPQPIQDAVNFPKTLQGFAPDDAAAIADLKGRLGNIRTLGGLNDLRMYLNTELSSEFPKNAVAAGRSGAVTSAMRDALSATRNMYYDELENATGQDFSGLKRQEGSVLSAEEALQNASPRLAAKQAIAEQPMSPRATLAEALQGAHTVSGSPIAGTARLVAQKVLGQMPMTPVQEGIQKFFNGAEKLPPSSAPPPRPAGMVNVPSAGARQVVQQVQLPAPASVAPNYVPPARVAAPASVQQLSTGTAAGNWGTPPALTSGVGNPEFVTPAASYPPLNPATAVTNVNAARPLVRPIARPVEPSAPTINVSPEGQATVQRALPPPETHAFSQKGWQVAHPNGNLKTAVKQAQAKGYRIID
jgi:hypothetical protein